MQLLLGSRPSQQPLSDAAVMIALRKGRIEFFRHLYRRHYAAVQAYASQCVRGPLHVQEVTSDVFAHLFQQMVSGESLIERRHPGCLRPQLLGKVRTTAINRWHRERDTLSPDFQAWVAAGSRWPWGEDGQLALAYERLPATTQCLLWHSVVERDDPVFTARITGLDHHAVPAACDQAMTALRQARADLYLERLERPDCRDVIERLTRRPEADPAEGWGHLRACPACAAVYKDLSQLDEQLEAQLPVRLLGWWTGARYLRAKAAIPIPLGDPPFLARLLERGPADAPAEPSRVHRATAATRGSRGRNRAASLQFPPRSRAAFAVAGFLVGVGAGVLLLTACDPQLGAHRQPPLASGPSPAPNDPPSQQATPPPALSARFPVQANAYTSQQGTSASPDPGARELGSSSVLRYDRVDFSTVRDTLAVARLAGPSGGGARIELRLDSPARPPLAQIIPSADGSVNDISVPITPVVGVHRVYVTAHCPTTTDRCVELFAFGAAPSLSGALLVLHRP
ncbi:carbohydrate-binding protein [Streptomyces sp. NBC_01410]|uniref:carbohydrate-binding protein n=1 Tax=Streptomyces sp. NBC_01410 TaxID=2903856 RepID=UPI00324CF339